MPSYAIASNNLTPPSFHVLAPNRVVFDQSKRTANISREILAGHGQSTTSASVMRCGTGEVEGDPLQRMKDQNMEDRKVRMRIKDRI